MASDMRCQTTHGKYDSQSTKTSFQLFSALSHFALTFSLHYIFRTNEMFYIAYLQKTRRANFRETVISHMERLRFALSVRTTPHAAVRSGKTTHVERSCILCCRSTAFPSQLRTRAEITAQRFSLL